MNLSPGQFVVWLIVAALVGNLVGRLVTLKKEGLGRWANLGVGMAGALIGGLLFKLLRIDLKGLADLKITLQDLIAAFVGSILFVFAWWLVGKFKGTKKSV